MTSPERLRRFFSSEPLPSAGGMVSLQPAETHQLKKVLRLKVGDFCLVTDGRGREARAQIFEFSKSGTVCLKVDPVLTAETAGRQRFFLRIFLAWIQRGKMDDLVEKAQELAIDEFAPIETEHTEIRLAPNERSKVYARWMKKLTGACKQSGAVKLVNLAPSRTFQEALEAVPRGEATVLFHPGSGGLSFKAWVEQLALQEQKGETLRLNLFFGPEGGFSPREIDRIKKGGFDRSTQPIIVRLEGNVLRLETAFVGTVAALRFLFS